MHQIVLFDWRNGFYCLLCCFLVSCDCEKVQKKFKLVTYIVVILRFNSGGKQV